jgi:hypothetical protein
MLAWNARVGYSLERLRTHPAYIELVFEQSYNDKEHGERRQDVCVITKKYTIDAP